MATFPTTESRSTPPLDAHFLLAEELSEIAERAKALTTATGVVIALRRSNELLVRTSNGIAPAVGACIPFPSGVTGLCVTTQKPQTCASSDVEAQLEAVFRAIAVHSILCVPLQWDGQVRGVLAVLSQRPDAFSRTHSAILMTLRDVIAHRLSQCEPPADPLPAASTPVVDLQSLVSEVAPEPAPVAPRPVAPTPPAPRLATPEPRKANPVPAPPVAPRPEHLPPAPLLSAAPKPPASRLAPPPAIPLDDLFKQAAAEVENPDVLYPAEDPRRYGSVLKPKPVAKSSVHGTAGASSAMLAAYRASKPRRNHVPLYAGCAAAVVLSVLVIAFHPWRKSGPIALRPAASEAAATTPAPASAPALVPVSLPKSAAEQPPAAAPSDHAVPSAPLVVHEAARAAAAAPKNVVVEPKPAVAELPPAPAEAAPKPSHALTLASGTPAAKSPAAKAEEPSAPPSLDLVAGAGKALPDVPIVSAPSRAIPVHQSVLIPATLQQHKQPQYPVAAQRMGISGVVTLQLTISTEGRVTDVRVVSGDPTFRQTSIAAVREWVYRPAYLDGKPVVSSAEVSLRFVPAGGRP